MRNRTRAAGLIAALVTLALIGALSAVALGGGYDKCKKYPWKCEQPTTTTTTTTTPPPPPTPRVCPDGKPPTPGEGAYDPNDDCKRPPPLEIDTVPQPPPAVPPPVLNCPAGMIEVARTATQVVCSYTTIVVKKVKVPVPGKTVTVTKIKRVKYCPAPKPCPKGYVRSPDGRCSPQAGG